MGKWNCFRLMFGLPLFPELENSTVMNTTLDYLRAHQYLYYVLHREVLTDFEYDMFGRDSSEDYKGGSDRASDYTPQQVDLAVAIMTRKVNPFPEGYTP